MEPFNFEALHIKTGDYVALEFAPNIKGIVIKTNAVMRGSVEKEDEVYDISYDVEIPYKISEKHPDPEFLMLHFMPTKALIKLDK